MLRKNQFIAVVSAMGVLLSLVSDLVKFLREAGLTIAELGECFAALTSKKGVGALKQIADLMVEEYRRQNPPAPPTLKAVIDTNLDPRLPFAGANIEKHARVGNVTIEKRSDGRLYIDGKKIVLYRSSRQLNGKTIKGHELRTEVDGKPVLSASILDFLKANPEFIPEDWKQDENGNTIYIFFWGTIYRSSGGGLYVRCLFWSVGEWCGFYGWLDDDWYSSFPAAMAAE